MKIGIELIGDMSLHFSPHHYFKLHLQKSNSIIEQSKGEDTFHYNGILLPGCIVSATGRKKTHKLEPSLNHLTGFSCVPILIPNTEKLSLSESLKDLVLCIDTNLIMSQGELQTYYTMKINLNHKLITLPLLCHNMRVHWQNLGIFHVYLNDLYKMLH